MLDFQIAAKEQGKKVHTTASLFNYQKSLLNGNNLDWTCVAGYKYLYVSAKGKFWLCCVNRQPNIDIMSVTPEILKSYFHKKECQDGCGIYCIVSESLANNHPMRFATREAWDRVRSKAGRLRYRSSV